jgi:hypothetical protein
MGPGEIGFHGQSLNSHLVDSVKGADLDKGRLKITFPAAARPGYVEQRVVLLCR